MDENSEIIGPDGSIWFQLLNRRVPVEEVHDQLVPFDEQEYLSSIAAFIIDNMGEVQKEDVLTSFRNNRAFGLDSYLLSILENKCGVGNSDLRKLKPSTALKKLYDLGCPELFYFHKTAAQTKTYNTEEEISPSPFSHGAVYLSSDLRTACDYIRGEDRYSYVMVLPMMEILQARENVGDIALERFGMFAVQVDFTAMDQEDLARIVEKTKIHKIDFTAMV